MESKRAPTDHEEVETLAEMVGRVLRLYSTELNLNQSKPTFERAIRHSSPELHATTSSRNPDGKTRSFKIESEA